MEGLRCCGSNLGGFVGSCPSAADACRCLPRQEVKVQEEDASQAKGELVGWMVVGKEGEKRGARGEQDREGCEGESATDKVRSEAGVEQKRKRSVARESCVRVRVVCVAERYAELWPRVLPRFGVQTAWLRGWYAGAKPLGKSQRRGDGRPQTRVCAGFCAIPAILAPSAEVLGLAGARGWC